MGWNTCDWIFIACGGVGCLACLFPVMQGPYRAAAPITSLNWPSRKYYVKLTTDKGMTPSVTWKYMKTEMCKRFEAAQLKYGTATGTLISSVMSATVTLPICDVQPACRQNMADRCTQYDRMVWNGQVLLIMVLLCSAMFGLALVLMFLSTKVKAKRNAWTLGVIGAVFQTGAFAYWVYDSDRFVSKMQELTIWPYPALTGWGLWTHCGGLCSIYASVVFGFMSWAMVGDGKSSDSYAEFEYEDPGAAYGATPMGGQAF